MSTRYSTQLQSSAITSITVSSSSSLESRPRDDNSHMAAVSNTHQSSPSSYLIRLAMRVSRARWFIFLRRVFHYQNGSRSDLGTNPFDSVTWMITELVALLVQITVITFTLALSENERPIWPVRLWITGYNVGCLLNLMLLYGRYRQQDVSQGNGFSFGDIEQQQRSREETRLPAKFSKTLIKI
uniref:E3 ubiquitin-protein ligase n=1 Tax=Noccaea caerulescens TaxID=107243 RepID=A0A1J3JF97_NOCCA